MHGPTAGVCDWLWQFRNVKRGPIGIDLDWPEPGAELDCPGFEDREQLLEPRGTWCMACGAPVVWATSTAGALVRFDVPTERRWMANSGGIVPRETYREHRCRGFVG